MIEEGWLGWRVGDCCVASTTSKGRLLFASKTTRQVEGYCADYECYIINNTDHFFTVILYNFTYTVPATRTQIRHTMNSPLRNNNMEDAAQEGPMNLHQAECSDSSSPVALVEEGNSASVPSTTAHDTMRRDMLQKYKEALKKREEARVELERLEHDAIMNGIPLIEDYVRDPLILDVKTCSIVNRKIPTFERVYMNSIPDSQQRTPAPFYPRQVSCPKIFTKEEQEETSSEDCDEEMTS